MIETLHRRHYAVMIAAALILMITMGMRQSTGLFFQPIIESTHVSYTAMSLAMAIGQLFWGLTQPAFGALGHRYGARPVLITGAFLLAAGSALTPFAGSGFMLIVTIGVLTAAGAGAGSFALLISEVGQRMPPSKRSFASGFVNAGGSLGQMVFAPANQLMIATIGWMGAMWTMAVAALATIPLIRPLMRGDHHAPQSTAGVPAPAPVSLTEQLRIAARNPSYWCLHAGFFTCGFHIAFLVTHLPGEVNLCMLPATVASTSLAIIGCANIAGSLMAGWAGGVMRMKWLLFLMYFSRAAIVLVYLAAPKTPTTFYLFAAALGFTWLATVPPTAGLVGKLFGMKHLATLFGLTMLTHQLGAFLGAYLGGIVISQFGDFSWMWYADAALAATAALFNLPIREAPLKVVAVRA